MDIEQLKAKLEQVKKQREEFIANANQQIAFLNGKIEALEEMLAPHTPSGVRSSPPATSPQSGEGGKEGEEEAQKEGN